jgi:hypothetical protein
MVMNIEPTSLLGLDFFGLTFDSAPRARNAVFTQIHQIVFHGKGGYDWHTVYNMPIWLRRFTFNEIQTYYTEEKDQIEKQNNPKSKTIIDSDGKIKAPEFLQNNQNKRPTKYK